MKKKYVESMKKRKEDEEKLRQIKLKQEKELKEINELKNKKRIEEEKLLLLIKGQLNKQEIKNYRKSIQNKDINHTQILSNINPFNINEEDKENRNIRKNNIHDLSNEYYIKDYTNFNDNKINNKNDNYYNHTNKTMLNKSIQESNIIYNSNENFKNIEKNNENEKINNQNKYLLPKESISSISAIKNKVNQMTINSIRINEKDENISDYTRFSPSIINKNKILSLSPQENKDDNNLQTELDQLISFSPVQNENNINEFINNKEKAIEILKEKCQNNINNKKVKKSIKNNLKDNDNIKEKLIKEYNKNQIKEEKSKIENEINKIDVITENLNISNEQVLYKSKSSSKINPYLKYTNANNNQYQNNYSSNNLTNINNEKEVNSKEENKKQYKTFIKETNKDLITSRNNKYLNNKEEVIPKQKSFMEDFILSNEINKEYLLDSNQEKRKNKQINYGTSSTNETKYVNNKQSENNKIKKEKIKSFLKYQENNCKIEENKSYNSGSQGLYYKDYFNNPERNILNDANENIIGDENNSKFFIYYKEIYGENKK